MVSNFWLGLPLSSPVEESWTHGFGFYVVLVFGCRLCPEGGKPADWWELCVKLLSVRSELFNSGALCRTSTPLSGAKCRRAFCGGRETLCCCSPWGHRQEEFHSLENYCPDSGGLDVSPDAPTFSTSPVTNSLRQSLLPSKSSNNQHFLSLVFSQWKTFSLPSQQAVLVMMNGGINVTVHVRWHLLNDRPVEQND